MNTSHHTGDAGLLSETVSRFRTRLLMAVALLIASAAAASADALFYTRSASEPITDATIGFGSHNPATTTSTLNISVPGSFGDVSDVDVRVRIDHPDVRQLRIAVQAPNGTTVTLLENGVTAAGTFLIGARSASGVNLKDTFFDADTYRPVTDGASPYSGRFEADLDTLAGTTAQTSGSWRLHVTDYRAGDKGTLVSWSVTLKNVRTETFTVTNLNDSGPGSLRAAVAGANLNDGLNEVVFAAGLTGTINLTSGPIEIIGSNRSGALVYQLERAGAGPLTIRNAGNSRVFTISAGGVRMTGLTLLGGISTTREGGGAIYNAGTLAVLFCTLRNNRAEYSGGPARGGAIANIGRLTVARSTLTQNSAEHGGAIYTVRNAVILGFCTLAGNTAADSGAGSGGAVYVGSGELRAPFSTITRNTSDGTGGAITNRASGEVTLLSSIVAQNSAPAGPDLSGEITGAYSLVGDGSGADYTDAGNSKVGTSAQPINARLGPLANNGGSTQTILPLFGSPALDSGTCEDAFGAPDQRGGFRDELGIDLLSFPNAAPVGACDMGSVELNPAVFANISTRIQVGLEDDVLIGGFIVTAPDVDSKKEILLRGLGPSLEAAGISDALADPVLQLYQGSTLLRTNNNWRDSQQAAIAATGIPPSNNLESAMIRTVDPKPYTAILRGRNSTTGVGLFELYDLEATGTSAVVANISTRGFVRTGNNVMIGGFILVGPDPARILLRGIGPSLADAGVEEPLSNPYLELFDKEGTKIAENDDWQETQSAAISATGVAPSRPKESALLIDLDAGSYTAVVRGADGGIGVGLVEAFNIR